MIKLIKKIGDYYSTRRSFKKGIKKEFFFKINDSQSSPWFIEKEIRDRLLVEENKYNLKFSVTYTLGFEQNDWIDNLITINVKYGLNDKRKEFI